MADVLNLDTALAHLEEELEEKPDKWFKAPKGYLKKPDFKRDAQRRSSILTGQSKSFFQKMTATGFKQRWFTLDNQKKLLRYFEDSDEYNERGAIDINTVLDVDYSQLTDAPPHSIDLITEEVHYTLQCKGKDDMLKWALAIKRLLKSYRRQQRAKSQAFQEGLNAPALGSKDEDDGADSDEQWFRYDHTYEDAGPIGLNVMGITNKDPTTGRTLNQWVVVSSFELDSEGKAGRSELSGVIAKDDYVVGVNGVDLTNSTFNEAFDIIKQATWPKTLHFLRNNKAAKEHSRIDSWAYVFYPALNRRRRRWCEVKNKDLNFRKAFPDGTVNQQRDAYLVLSDIVKVVPILDLRAAQENPDQAYILQLHCKAAAQVEHVAAGSLDQSVGGSPVEILELCFHTEQAMNSWRSTLVSPGPHSDTGLTMEPLQTLELDGSGLGSSGTSLQSDGLAIRSTLTGKFSVRDFSLKNGTIFWQRPKVEGMASSERSKRKLFIADSSKCNLEKIAAFKLSPSVSEEYRFLLKLTTKESNLSIAFPDAAGVAQWQDALKGAVSKTPELAVPSTLTFSSKEEDEEEDNDEEGGDDEGRESVAENFDVYTGSVHGGEDEESEMFQGYLYKRNDRTLPKGFSPNAAFQKAYVVYKNDTLNVYHSRIEFTSSLSAYLTIPFAGVLEIREATDANVPENCFEVVTIEKVYIFAASDEDSLLVWLEALSDLLEARDVNVQQGVHAGGGTLSEAERVKKIKDSVRFSGGLTMKSVNLYTGLSTWRDRFVVISYGSLAYYSESKDVYNPEKDSINDVNLVGMVQLETSRESRCATNCAFDMTAAVSKGGDDNGMRTFIFEARTPELCKQWMEELCRACDDFELHPSTRVPGGHVAVRKERNDPNAMAARANLYSGNVSTAASAMGGRGGASRRLSGRGGLAGRGGGGRGFTATKADPADKVTEGMKRTSINAGDGGAGNVPKVEAHAARRASTLLAKGGRGGRGGGRGRRASALGPAGGTSL